ncbi:ABC transporter ATP-binding protein [Chitinophaga ginsengisoli]|uniref:ABC-type multidrug transport system ATPase subunit n=1 Tax=Chitinophaga ginsengisoli TaxID=363837 RepID=A0A2P8GAM5_9BACT|nr:ABC transporter ATP-binding protein [Chitinophaga ginsengisoli]PSL31037.1 ABC-type multidrug transport system ATPase subunit [Chitinophaga ginsengisoli]
MKLTISNLTKTYPNGVQALKNVSLTIRHGLFGLLGPNGAGKSSLMRIIATLQQADSGSISLDNLDVLKNKTAVRQLLGYLPQDFGVYPKISALHMLDHIARLKGLGNAAERKEQIEALLVQVNLYQDRKKYLGTFSGGMKQRFGIAQALIGNPKLLIVDEPTAGLDPMERNRFYNLLSLLGENIIVILSTHIVEDVSTLCSSFAIIKEGKIIYAGSPEEAIAGMRGRVYSKVISVGDLRRYESALNVVSTQLKNGKLHIRVVQDQEPGREFVTAAPGLEDVYFSQITKPISNV